MIKCKNGECEIIGSPGEVVADLVVVLREFHGALKNMAGQEAADAAMGGDFRILQ